MLVIPAIDLKDGQCVRLRQGRMEDETVFGDNPVEVAQRWVDAGARRLHMVDLNGAFAGRPVNAGAIKAVADGLIAEGHNVVNFGIGEMNPEIPVPAAIKAAIKSKKPKKKPTDEDNPVAEIKQLFEDQAEDNPAKKQKNEQVEAYAKYHKMTLDPMKDILRW